MRALARGMGGHGHGHGADLFNAGKGVLALLCRYFALAGQNRFICVGVRDHGWRGLIADFSASTPTQGRFCWGHCARACARVRHVAVGQLA